MNSELEPKVIIDLPPIHAGPYPSISPSSIDVGGPASWRPPPRKNGLPIVLGVMGACGTLAALAGVLGVHRWHERQKEDARYSQEIADSKRRAAREAQTAPPTIDPAPIAIADPIPTMTLDAPPAPPPIAKPKPTVATQPKPAPKANQTGLVRTYTTAAGKAIFIDGKQAGVAPAPLTVQCGPHSIRVGTGKARNVSVPCGGNVTVGTPDGD
jgi:hypothetical protein